MALSDIPQFFPPTSGDSRVGWKDLFQPVVENDGTFRESLVGLHEPAWWTGVRIASLDANQEFRVELLKLHDEFAIGTWTQRAGVWTAFPWAIPAKMASLMGLMLRITPLGTNMTTPQYAVRTAFAELSTMPVDERYLFFDETGVVQFYWNGRRQAWGSRSQGAEPQWRSIHMLVPPSSMLEGWNDNRVFCMHEWSETVPVLANVIR